MFPRLARRSLLGAGMALPLLGLSARAAGSSGVLRLGLSSYPPNLTPWINAGSATGTVMTLMHRGLLSFDAQGKLQGEIAERWEADGKDWVFHLRDVTFHNGKKLTPADVKWSIEQVGGEKSTAYMRPQFQNVAQVETPDARTVRLVMKQPMTTIPEWLATYFMPIVAQNSVERGGSGVGAGPFVLKASERGTSIDLEAFPGFYKPGLPKLKGVRIVAYPDENARVAALIAGDVDMIDYVPWQSMARIESEPKLRLDTQNGPFMYLNFNGRSGPLANPLVRQAIGFAINRQDIVRSAFFGRGSPIHGAPLSPDSPYFSETAGKAFRHDPAQAKALLAKAGLPDGFSCNLLSTAQYGMHKDTGEVVQQNLATVGIQVQLNLPDWATRVQLGNRGQYDLAVNGTAVEIADPDGMSPIIDNSLPPSYTRSTGFETPGLNRLLAEGRAESDVPKRKAIYAKVQDLVVEDVPTLALCYRSQGYAMTRALQGFANLPGPLTFYSPATLDGASLP
ncbi:ABC transporter substrate-binding protein [Roseomonas gilardii subsp. gilardii]|uniref:ABC transporter substrate-binding protein n=1 Tax=Roseomonas gilardii TaxID=257708 RepID=UPI001FF7EB07|nr:ABC transporter substrate-binding protein [Roseomonas gilardii]UPG74049.1 ABC transporter substrate-binding protein [Roseomonas gilardii subsp. gilardii]